MKGIYDAQKAHHKAYVRRKDARYQGKVIVRDVELKAFVDEKLLSGVSPEAIAGRLTHEKLTKVSKDSVYRYLKSVYGRNIEIQRSKQKKKKRGKKKKTKKQKLEDRTFIAERPEYINKRERIGDVEADFIVSGKSGTGRLLVVVDRKIRVVFIARILSVTVAQTHRAFRWIQNRFPEMKSITTDNDLLLQKHKHLEKLLGVPIYFCDPYASWQKGTVENANKHIRKTIPKGSDISQYSREVINHIEEQLNSRYMKCLDYETPQELLEKFRNEKSP